MRIADSTLERAMLDLYALRGLRSGDAISMRALHDAWTLTGLRSDDFRDALRLLLRRGQLRLWPVDDGNQVELTDDGYARMQSSGFRAPADEDDLEDLRTLRQVRRRVGHLIVDWRGADRRDPVLSASH